MYVVSHVQEHEEFDLKAFFHNEEILHRDSLGPNDLSPIVDFDVFVDFKGNNHGVEVNLTEADHQINYMDLIPPEEHNGSTLAQPMHPHFLETGIRIHH